MRGRRGRGDEDTPRRPAYDKALDMLVRREHSRRELHARLARSGYDEEESESALDRLGAENYQDDRRFGELVVRSRVSQGYGPARIRMELGSHGLSSELVDELLAAADVDWDAEALALVRRRFADRDSASTQERARLTRFLLRRGFAAATVRRITHAEVDDSAGS